MAKSQTVVCRNMKLHTCRKPLLLLLFMLAYLIMSLILGTHWAINIHLLRSQTFFVGLESWTFRPQSDPVVIKCEKEKYLLFQFLALFWLLTILITLHSESATDKIKSSETIFFMTELHIRFLNVGDLKFINPWLGKSLVA